MLATILKSDIAVLRAIQIVMTFSDLERMAHGEQPKQPGFAELMQMITKMTQPTFSKEQLIKERMNTMNAIFDTLGKPDEMVVTTLRNQLLFDFLPE
jgi:hypothetical protein